MHTKLFAVPWYGLAALCGTAAAQTPLAYESAYAGYKAYVEAPVASWRAVNEEAARVGGHAGIFGGAAPSAHGTAKPAQEAPPPKPAASPSPHGAHH